MNKKKLFRWSHLWLGLVSAIILFVMSLTGTIFVFADEITDASAGDARYVQSAEGQAPLSVDTLIKDFQQQVPHCAVLYIDTYQDTHRSFRIASKDTLNGVYAYTYVQPYTGKVLKTSRVVNFFNKVITIHTELLMGDTGKMLVGLATLIFLIEVVSGIIIWIPRRWTKTARNNAFLMKKNPSLKRFNYDLHKVVSFYILIPAVVLAVTGLVMTYEFVGVMARSLGGGEPHLSAALQDCLPKADDNQPTASWQAIVESVQHEAPHAQQYRIYPPKHKVGAYRIKTADYIGIINMKDGRESYINAYTAQPIQLTPKIERGLAIKSMNVNIHAATWGGLTTKIIQFIVGLICTSLPITGFIIWWGKKRAKRRQAQKQKTTTE